MPNQTREYAKYRAHVIHSRIDQDRILWKNHATSKSPRRGTSMPGWITRDVELTLSHPDQRLGTNGERAARR
jgi:hypothetical protein